MGYTGLIVLMKNMEGNMASKYGFINPMDFSGNEIKKAQEIDFTIKEILTDLTTTLKIKTSIHGPKEVNEHATQYYWMIDAYGARLQVVLLMQLNGAFWITVKASVEKDSNPPSFLYDGLAVNVNLVAQVINTLTDIPTQVK